MNASLPVVLLVDESPVALAVHALFLEEAGYTCVVSLCGAEALEKIALYPVAAVVTGVNLPRLDGYALTRRIRAMQGHGNTPIIMVSCEDDPRDAKLGEEAGVTAYFVKPLAPATLVEAVGEHLKPEKTP